MTDPDRTRAEAHMGERVARMEGQLANNDRDLQSHLNNCVVAHKEIQLRFTRLERIIWMAVGGGNVILAAIMLVLKK